MLKIAVFISFTSAARWAVTSSPVAENASINISQIDSSAASAH